MTALGTVGTGGPLAGDAGSATSLSMVLIVPVFCVLATMTVQAAMWGHARTEARVAARETAVLVARRDLDTESAAAALRRVIEAGSGVDHLSSLSVEVVEEASTVSVRVTGSMPGLVHGLAAPIDVVETMSLEGWRR
jgi:hypothetical protein